MAVKHLFDETHSLVQVSLPVYLFRYMRDADYVVDSLLAPSLWFSSLREFNDPLESKNRLEEDVSDELILWYLRHYSRKTGFDSEAPVTAEFWEQMRSSDKAMAHARSGWRAAMEGLFQLKMDQVSVCCCSDRPDISLMWAHYADGHRGVCLVLKAPFLLRSGRIGLYEVLYAPRIASWNHATMRRALGASDEYHVKFDQAVLATKSEQWRYEREHRLISHSRGVNSLPEQALAGVILGSRMPAERASEIKRLLMERWGHLPGFAVVRAGIDSTTGTTWVPGYPEFRIDFPAHGSHLPDECSRSVQDYLHIDDAFRVLHGEVGISPEPPLENTQLH